MDEETKKPPPGRLGWFERLILKMAVARTLADGYSDNPRELVREAKAFFHEINQQPPRGRLEVSSAEDCYSERLKKGGANLRRKTEALEAASAAMPLLADAALRRAAECSDCEPERPPSSDEESA